MTIFKRAVIATALTLTLQTGANAALIDLGTLVPQETINLFQLAGSNIDDDYQFNVTQSFAFTAEVTAYDSVNFDLSLSDVGGVLFNQDSSVFVPSIVPAFFNAEVFSITEKILGPGTYTFNLLGSTIAPASAYTGSFTVGRATVAAVPEPETYAMFLAGLSLLGFVKRRKA